MDRPKEYDMKLAHGPVVRVCDAKQVSDYIDFLLQGVQMEDFQCPMCGGVNTEGKTFHHLPSGLTVYGLSLKQIAEALSFAREHGWEVPR